MKENIEEDIRKIEEYIELVLNKGYCECNELNEIIGKHCDGSKNVAYAIDELLSDYKKVLKENEEWKKAYQEENDKQFDLLKEILKLQKENEELKNRWDKDTHKLQNDLDIANAEIIRLKKGR